MRKIAAFLRDERGSYTIEFCLWIPVFIFFLAATIDASVLYLTHTEMWNVCRDTARRVTTGELADADAAKAHMEDEVLLAANGYLFYVPDFDGKDEVQVGMAIKLAGDGGASIFGIFGWVGWWAGYSGEESFNENYLWAKVIMRREPDFI